MAFPSQEEMDRLVRELGARPGLPEQLPKEQQAVVRAALNGQDVHTLANDQGLDEAAVWRILDDAARWAAGKPRQRSPEQGGMGGDTDPGVTGGYGDTGFGSIGNEPPIPNPDEPSEPDK